MAPNDPIPLPPDAQVVLARPIQVWPYARALPVPPSPLELTGLSRRAAALDLGLVLLVALVIPFGFDLLAALWVGEGEFEVPSIPLLTMHKWSEALLASVLLGYLVLRHRLPPACFGLRNDRPLRQVAWSVGALAATYGWLLATVAIFAALIVLYPQLQDELMHRVGLLKQMPVRDWRWTLLLLVPVAIHEEVIFRALLLPYLRRLVGSWWLAVPISAAMFAVLHFDQGLVGVLQVFGVALALSVFFIRSRSVFAVIVAHFAFDFLQFQLIRWVL